MIFPCNPHNPREDEDERKRTKKSKRRNYKQRREAKLTALMMTAQLRPETPSLQKLRNETLEKRKAHKNATQNANNKRTNTRTPSLTHSLLVCSLARSLAHVTLIRYCDFHTGNGQNQNLDSDFEVVFNNCNRLFVAGAQNSDLRVLIGRSP
jgi:hypothetical protein